jgi:hypothetical protein
MHSALKLTDLRCNDWNRGIEGTRGFCHDIGRTEFSHALLLADSYITGDFRNSNNTEDL